MHDFIKYFYVGHFMMSDKDIKEYHDLDKLKQYHPLPSGLTIADSRISGQGVFTTRRLVAGTELGISHWRIEREFIRTPLGGFINHKDNPNCEKVKLYFKSDHTEFTKWNLITIKDIKEGEELTLQYTFYKI